LRIFGRCINKFFTEAFWLVALPWIFDSLDTHVAKLAGKESLFGKEFDSIADAVSFRLAWLGIGAEDVLYGTKYIDGRFAAASSRIGSKLGWHFASLGYM
jgi:CDP-diacylglycerol--serine O-phosphatidyltransferase